MSSKRKGNLDIFRYLLYDIFQIYDGEATCLLILPFYDCKFAKCHIRGI